MQNKNIVITRALRKRFDEGWKNGRIIFFSAPCGTGKTASALSLTMPYNTLVLDASDSGFSEKSVPEKCECVLIDDFQMIKSESDRDTVLSWLKKYPALRFVFLSRGVLPSWLASWRTTGLLTTVERKALILDKAAAAEFFERSGVRVSDEELRAILSDTMGYPIALAILSELLSDGTPYSSDILREAELRLYYYLEEAVYRRFEANKRSVLVGLAPFECFDTALARLVSGDGHVGELISELLHETTMLVPSGADSYRFWPVFKRFLLWELGQEYSAEQQKSIYRRAALCYELKNDCGKALWCYERAGDHSRVSELLVKNGRNHPGTAQYYDLERYYYALTEEEILRSPELMSAMSMLTALSMNIDASEKWYDRLKEYAASLSESDANYKAAKSRLLYLDISLPQRGCANMVDILNTAFRVLTNKEFKLPEVSVTSTLPSIMNGGKDFCRWSKRDDFLYATMRRIVEAVLGRDGVGLADAAICESKLEKGEDVSERILTLMTRMPDIRHSGTPDTEFAAMALVIRSWVLRGKAEEALSTLGGLRDNFERRGHTRFFPNMDAMRQRILLRLGKVDEAAKWQREKAPSVLPSYRVLYRYQYMTAALVCLARGSPEDALTYVAPFLPYCEVCGRVMDSVYIHIITAICRCRMKNELWREELTKALDTMYEYDFVTPISQFGAAALPLLSESEWDGDKGKLEKAWFDKVVSATRRETLLYPDFLKPPAILAEPFTPSEKRVLRLICYNFGNQEIADVLGVKLPTVKTQVRSILQKLGVAKRTEAKEAALRLGLVRLDDVPKS